MCFHSAMKHENDVSDLIGCLQVVRIYSFTKEIKFYTRASYIVFLFVKSENNFIKQIKYVLRDFIAWWKSRQSLWEFSNSPKRFPRFSPGYEGTEKGYFFSQSQSLQVPQMWLVHKLRYFTLIICKIVIGQCNRRVGCDRTISWANYFKYFQLNLPITT